MKLMTKTRHGTRVYKVYDTARTPYQQLEEGGALTEAKQHGSATFISSS